MLHVALSLINEPSLFDLQTTSATTSAMVVLGIISGYLPRV